LKARKNAMAEKYAIIVPVSEFWNVNIGSFSRWQKRCDIS
jgi:hypothetical protein